MINLGYPPDKQRRLGKQVVSGSGLSLGVLHGALRPTLFVVREVLLGAWKAASEDDFTGTSVERLMKASH